MACYKRTIEETRESSRIICIHECQARLVRGQSWRRSNHCKKAKRSREHLRSLLSGWKKKKRKEREGKEQSKQIESASINERIFVTYRKQPLEIFKDVDGRKGK